MRIIHQEHNIGIDFEEGYVEVLCVENPKVLAMLVDDLLRQIEGGTGGWILSEKEKVLLLSKHMAGIINPFALDCNERKILNKIYSEFVEIASNEYPVETAELNGKIVDYLDMLFQRSAYHLDMQTDLDIAGILKLYDVKMEIESKELIERIIDYLRALHYICKIDMFAFVHLKEYLTEEELGALYEFANYEKLSLLFIESRYGGCLKYEKWWIYDKDLCMINVDMN